MKTLRVFVALLLTVATLTHSRPSQAAVGAAFSAPVLIAGIVIAGGGSIVTVKMLHDCRGDSSGLCAGLTALVLGPIVILGLVILDGEQKVEFKELNLSQAQKLGISSQELAVYNSELDQANMLVADVQSELSKIENPDETDSAAAWNAVKEMVSPETFATMTKIVSQQ
jgi:hypothetical protein